MIEIDHQKETATICVYVMYVWHFERILKESDWRITHMWFNSPIILLIEASKNYIHTKNECPMITMCCKIVFAMKQKKN